MKKTVERLACAMLLAAGVALCQDAGEILKRLDRLEAENESLRRQIGELRQQVERLRGVEERVEIQERRVDEQAQTKVEASEKFPVRLRGMLVTNLFHNSPHAGGVDVPVAASRVAGRRAAGLAIRQSIIGLEYRGPATLWGGRVDAAVAMDFFEGTTEVNNLPPLRMRTGHVGLHWETRSLTLSLDKPLFSPRDPNSFSYVGISPLTGSGNLWRWTQQVRFEQRFGSETTGLRAQAAVAQTTEDVGTSVPPPVTLERRRPALQGRFALFHKLDGERMIEVAPSFHVSTTHAGGVPVNSSLLAVDWFASVWPRLQFSGMYFHGENVGHFGGGGRQGFTVRGPGNIIAVKAQGGWGQVSTPLTPRVTLNVFGGMHDSRNRDLLANGLSVNRTGAANVMVRIAPNVFVTMEAMQLRSTYLDAGGRKNNRYDLSLAYLF